jgi:hypothetical protein
MNHSIKKKQIEKKKAGITDNYAQIVEIPVEN